MPNWVSHQITVRGPRETLRAFRRANRARDVQYDERDLPAPLRGPASTKPAWRAFSFAAAVPVPPEVQAQPYDPVGYQWQLQHWGTKWDASSVQITRRPDRLQIAFATPWRLPMPWFTALIAAWPTLHFTWWAIEDQPAFCFRITATNGAIVTEQEWLERLKQTTPALTAAELAEVWACPFRADLAPRLFEHPVLVSTARGRQWAQQALAEADWRRAALLGQLTRLSRGRLRRKLWRQGLAEIQTASPFEESEPVAWLDALLGSALSGDDDHDEDREEETETARAVGVAAAPPQWVEAARALSRADRRDLVRALLLSPVRELRMAGTRLAGALGTLDRPTRPRRRVALAGAV